MNVLLLNLRTDADDDVLGFTTSWINSIARRVDSVSVITMTCGRLAVDANVRVFSLGKEKGNSKPRRALEFYRHIIAIVSERRIHVCFAHMAPLFAAMASPILGPLRIPIVLWYAHKAVNNILKLATAVSTVVVASSASGFRIATPKLRIIGQGIDTELFQPDEQTADTQNSLFVVGTVGRVSRVKNIHQIIEAFGQIVKSRPHAPLLLKVVGAPLNKADQQYLSALSENLYNDSF